MSSDLWWPHPESQHHLHEATGAVVLDCSLCVARALEVADSLRARQVEGFGDSLAQLALRASLAEKGQRWVPGHMETFTTTSGPGRAMRRLVALSLVLGMILGASLAILGMVVARTWL